MFFIWFCYIQPSHGPGVVMRANSFYPTREKNQQQQKYRQSMMVQYLPSIHEARGSINFQHHIKSGMGTHACNPSNSQRGGRRSVCSSSKRKT